jgi:hypothetical protein
MYNASILVEGDEFDAYEFCPKGKGTNACGIMVYG